MYSDPAQNKTEKYEMLGLGTCCTTLLVYCTCVQYTWFVFLGLMLHENGTIPAGVWATMLKYMPASICLAFLTALMCKQTENFSDY